MNKVQIPKNIPKINNANNKTSVILVYSGEDSMYSTTNQITRILLQKNKKDILFYPIKLYENKLLYNKIGKSQYKNKTKEFYNKLCNEIEDDYKVYMGYLYDDRYLEKEILNIVKEGYQKIIVVPMFLDDNYNVLNLKKRIEDLKLYNYGIEYKYIDTLWKSESLVDSYIEKIKLNFKNINKSGINLVGIDKDIIDENKGESIKQNILFRNKIKEKLITELNIDPSLIKLSWYNDLSPDFISKNMELFEYGISELIILPVNVESSDLIKYDIYHHSIKTSELPEGVKVKVIDGFVNDNNMVKDIIKKIEYIDMQKWKN
jgi:protoheme ferro-lyase